MADDEVSRSSGGEDDDFEDDIEDNGFDNEDTIAEEEALADADYGEELRGLEEEGEMSIEELRRKYGMPIEGQNSMPEGEQQPESSGLQSGYNYFNDYDDAEDDDKEYIPENNFKKEIRIDPELYQAIIPEFEEEIAEDDGESSANQSILLWSPTDKLTNEQINEYLKSIIEIRKDLGQYIDDKYSEARDDEDSLCALYRADYDPQSAKEQFPFPQVNKANRTIRPNALEWDDGEKACFEKSLTLYGKDFNTIKAQSALNYRSIGELVDYYYKWKKTERYKEYRRRHSESEEERYRRFAAAVVLEPPLETEVVAELPPQESQE